ncbi:MAG: VF530 family DNA-binding protein [Sandaracinaceae bacterium]
MSEEQPDNLMHGVTLKALLEDLVERRGWAELADEVPIRCFENDPSLKSSLKFLRRTPWARQKVEALWMQDEQHRRRRAKKNKRRKAMRQRRAENEDD